MSLKKNYVVTISIYLLVFLSPSILNYVTTGGRLILCSTLIYLVGALFLVIVYKQANEKAPLEQKERASLSTIVLWVILGLIFAVMVQFLANLIEQLFVGTPIDSANTKQITYTIKQYPVYLLTVCVGAPIMEELVFRRALFHLLELSFPFWMAILGSSFLFALAHGDGHYLVYTSLGLIFSFLYKKTGTIVTPILTHILMNSTVVALQLFLT